MSFFLSGLFQLCTHSMKKMNRISTILLLLFISPAQLKACSAFFYNNERKIYGKNFDWSSGHGFIIKNNRGQVKYAYGIRGNKQAKWISKYGSFTFNQIGKENPYGGMNEKGLVVEQLWLSTSQYQENNTATISELEWIQFQLDNYSSVPELIENINTLTIQPTKATVHYLVADKDGKSAVIDFVNGKTIISAIEKNFQVITNSTYQNSLNYLAKSGNNVNNQSRTSEDRFCQLTNNLSRNMIKEPVHAFEVLKKSAEDRQNYKTYWTIVYDIDKREIHYKSYNDNTVKIIRLPDYTFQDNEPVAGCAINTSFFKLEAYTSINNLSLLDSSLQMMQLKLDNRLANEHQMNPNQNRIDTVYTNNYTDIKLTFNIKKKKGILFYTFIRGAANFKSRKGIYSTMTQVTDNFFETIIYTFPKGEYAIAAFHDINSDYAIDKGLFGIPKAFAFSNNAKGLLGLPPKYEKAKINLQHPTHITINIK